MKKQYSKPGIIIEDFRLAESIAGCNSKPGEAGSTVGYSNHYDKLTCGWVIGGLVYWTSPDAKCNKIVGEDFPVEGVCYNNSNGGNVIYNSL